jgi:hypothetical protein
MKRELKMLHIEEPTIRSFFQGNPFRLTTPLFSAYIPTLFPFPTNSWPPSLVPTWKTTAWTGVCFSHAKKGAYGFMQGYEAGHENTGIFRQISYRETSLITANARAPP